MAPPCRPHPTCVCVPGPAGPPHTLHYTEHSDKTQRATHATRWLYGTPHHLPMNMSTCRDQQCHLGTTHALPTCTSRTYLWSQAGSSRATTEAQAEGAEAQGSRLKWEWLEDT